MVPLATQTIVFESASESELRAFSLMRFHVGDATSQLHQDTRV